MPKTATRPNKATKSKKHACGRCGQEGHNARTCETTIRQSPDEFDKSVRASAKSKAAEKAEKPKAAKQTKKAAKAAKGAAKKPGRTKKQASDEQGRTDDGPDLEATPDDETILVDPDDVEIPPEGHFLFQPGRNNEPIDENTVNNYMAFGVLQNIGLVREGGRSWVVFGRQRVKNAREAKRRQIEKGFKHTIKLRAIVKRGMSNVMLRGLMVSENQHRKDVDPVEQAREMQGLLDMGLPKDGLPMFFKCSAKVVDRRLKMLELKPKTQAATSKRQMPARLAEKVAAASPEVQDRIEEKIGAATTDEEVKAAVVSEVGDYSDAGPGKKLIATLADDELLEDPVRAALLWAVGKLSDAEAFDQIEGLEAAVERARDGDTEKAMARARAIQIAAGRKPEQIAGAAGRPPVG